GGGGEEEAEGGDGRRRGGAGVGRDAGGEQPPGARDAAPAPPPGGAPIHAPPRDPSCARSGPSPPAPRQSGMPRSGRPATTAVRSAWSLTSARYAGRRPDRRAGGPCLPPRGRAGRPARSPPPPRGAPPPPPPSAGGPRD